MKYRDYYNILGVSRDASKEEIRKAFRSLARKYHPDTNRDPEAEARFKEVNEAYEVLGDPEKRQRYDALGSGFHAGQEFRPPPGFSTFEFTEPGGGGGAFAFSDFFEMLFGGMGGMGGGFRGGAGAHVRPQARNFETEITLSLEEAQRGGKRAFELIRPDQSGAKRRYEITIPPGTRDGAQLRLRGQGEAVAGGEVGDLIVRVRLREHPLFRVEGDNLRTEVPVTPWEAALGAKVPVPTLSGSVTLSIPPGTRSGRTLRLGGQGLSRKGGGKGDLLVSVRIEVPTELTERERELFEALAKESTFQPRRD
ncbi:DnaJ domain-containing protein [Candidatus Sumerlaeota bacterium]|nr:DnaJ domain-containing protein [Candidatus Sumerlaeota bacterium]